MNRTSPLRWWQRLLVALMLLAGCGLAAARDVLPQVHIDSLPPEARQTLLLIKRGGPFPHGKDGSIFGNFERRLPSRPRGYYREYTVPTPGARNRGARRIIAGDQREFFYTEDHYRTFTRIVERR